MMRSSSIVFAAASALALVTACDGFFGFRDRRLVEHDPDSGVDAPSSPDSTDLPDAEADAEAETPGPTADAGADGGAGGCPDGTVGLEDGGCSPRCDPTQIKWAPASGGLEPAGAFLGSEENGVRLYVCRAQRPQTSDVLPGKLFLKYGGCFYGDGTQEVGLASYEVLVPGQCTLRWQKVTGGNIPGSALPAGRTQYVLWSCRVHVNGDFHLGHVGASTGNLCRYSNGRQSYDEAAFEVLTLP